MGEGPNVEEVDNNTAGTHNNTAGTHDSHTGSSNTPSSDNSSSDITALSIILAHTIDDHEKMRTNVLRTTKQQLDLLADARHALNHGSPHVTDEYLERTIDAFTNMIATLTRTTAQ